MSYCLETNKLNLFVIIKEVLQMFLSTRNFVFSKYEMVICFFKENEGIKRE